MDIAYDPHPDRRPDPGEIVWTWLPYEDDPMQGKDRSVLIVARQGESLPLLAELVGGPPVALQMTSKDHDRDLAREAADGRYWFDIGSGPWDSAGRAGEVRLRRLLTVDPADVRREGAVLEEARFVAVAAALEPYLP